MSRCHVGLASFFPEPHTTTRNLSSPAFLTVTKDRTIVSQKQMSNSAGLFALPSIAVGAYTVSVEMPGFKTQ